MTVLPTLLLPALSSSPQPWKVNFSQRSMSSHSARFPSGTSLKLISPTATHRKTTPLSFCSDLSVESRLVCPPAYPASPHPLAGPQHLRPVSKTNQTSSPKPAPVLPSLGPLDEDSLASLLSQPLPHASGHRGLPSFNSFQILPGPQPLLIHPLPGSLQSPTSWFLTLGSLSLLI